MILNARHLKQTLTSYFAYYHGSRTHLGLDKQCPFPRQVSSVGKIIEIPQLGGLHHRYQRVAAQRLDGDVFLANDRPDALLPNSIARKIQRVTLEKPAFILGDIYLTVIQNSMLL